MVVKRILVLLTALITLFGCAESAQTKRNKFDACVINEMSGYWDVQRVKTYVPPFYADKEVFVKSTVAEAEQSCVYFLE